MLSKPTLGNKSQVISMAKSRRKTVSFIAKKKVSKPVKVKFYTKTGEKVSFAAKKKVTKPVKVEFYAKKKRK